MIRILLITFIIFLNYFTVLSYSHIEVPIEVSDEQGSFYNLSFGVDTAATNTYDSLLGERNFPSFPTKEFHAAFIYYDSVRLFENVLSYKDFRPIIDSTHYYVEYTIKVFRGDGELLIFSWNTLPQFIDSARITDIDNDFEFFPEIVMNGTKRKDTIKNKYINDYYVKVWYNNPLADVEVQNPNNNNSINIYPTISDGNLITINSGNNRFSYKIYNETGIEMLSGNSETGNKEIEITSLNKGIYFIVLNTGGVQIVRKLARI
ncbi:MAG: T9SS type A sorting domain-containing protein [Ignavibacteriae bacterium]|nr:T9SS type A sorting domain-containing protein [Ignavibacteriota bacterium]